MSSSSAIYDRGWEKKSPGRLGSGQKTCFYTCWSQLWFSLSFTILGDIPLLCNLFSVLTKQLQNLTDRWLDKVQTDRLVWGGGGKGGWIWDNGPLWRKKECRVIVVCSSLWSPNPLLISLHMEEYFLFYSPSFINKCYRGTFYYNFTSRPLFCPPKLILWLSYLIQRYCHVSPGDDR